MREYGGHLRFYEKLSDQSGGLVLAGHRTGCCVQQCSRVMCEPSSMAVIRASLGCALAEWWPHTGALKLAVQKASGIWIAHLTSTIISAVWYQVSWVCRCNAFLYTDVLCSSYEKQNLKSPTDKPDNCYWRQKTTKNYNTNMRSFRPLCAWVCCILWDCNKRAVKCNTSLYKR